MLDSERTFKIKVRLRWTVSEILFTSTIMLCAFQEFCMETRLSNIFKTKNITNLTKVIQENSYRLLQVTSRLLFKGSWILPYSWHSNWEIVIHILGKVAKSNFSESPQESLKIRQNSYQQGHLLRSNGPSKIWKICVFWRLLFQKTIADIWNL